MANGKKMDWRKPVVKLKDNTNQPPKTVPKTSGCSTCNKRKNLSK